MTERRQPIVVLHIPKTAGTSLRRLIQENYPSEDIYYIYGEDSQFTTLKDFNKLTIEEKSNYKIFMGHIPFNQKLFAHLQPTYITMLRNPIDRVLSYYHHVMQREEWKEKNISLLKYIENSNDSQLSNHQTRMLTGFPKVPIDEMQLEIAIKNLESHFTIVGITEYFREAAEALRALFGWENNMEFKENVSVGRKQKEYYSDLEIDKIRELNKFDIKLYEHMLIARRSNIA